MPWVTPSTVNTGDTLQASTWNQDVVGNSLMGNPVFTNEAARDAAIPSPSEGQRAYLTAPSVPAATGGSTFIPTGVQTIYNGSVWVCATMVGALTTNSGTTASDTFTATLGGSPGTNPSVTLVTGTTAAIYIAAQMSNDNATGGGLISIAVSGATTLAASDDNSLIINLLPANGTIAATHLILMSGLTAGTNTFTLNYRRVSAGTITVVRRRITACGIA